MNIYYIIVINFPGNVSEQFSVLRFDNPSEMKRLMRGLGGRHSVICEVVRWAIKKLGSDQENTICITLIAYNTQQTSIFY